MESDSELCRLCLVPVDPAAVVILNQAEKMIEAIQQITSIQVIIDPACDVFMCDQCQTSLDMSRQFRSICIQNDEIFRKMHVKHAISMAVVKDEPDHFESEFVQCKLEEEPEHDEIIKKESDQNVQDDLSSSKRKKPKKPRKKHSSKDLNSGPSSKVQCHTCGAFISRHHLSKHHLTHEKDRPMFACEKCPKKYTERRKLKEHITIVHEGNIAHTCDRCGRTFHRSETLRQHYLGEHTNLKKYECKICGEKFARAANRDYHYKMNHTSLKPHACEYCDKSFKRSHDLTLHVRTHTGEKPFKCDLCDKRFAKSYNVVIHKKSHKNAELRKKAQMVAESAGQGLTFGMALME